MPRLLLALALSALASTTFAGGGYLGLGTSLNNSNDFDHEDDGLRVDWGAKIHPNLYLEWNYVDFGKSIYNDPTFVPGNEDDDDEDNDLADFTGTRFGEVNRGQGRYTGFSDVHVKGIATGLKWHGGMTESVRVFLRTSLLAWQGSSTEITIEGPRVPSDADGDPLPDGADPSTAENQNSCGNFSYCRIEKEGKTYWAVNYWMGAGFSYQPLSWLQFRAEASTITVKAEGFPQATYESIGATMELHF